MRLGLNFAGFHRGIEIGFKAVLVPVSGGLTNMMAGVIDVGTGEAPNFAASHSPASVDVRDCSMTLN